MQNAATGLAESNCGHHHLMLCSRVNSQLNFYYHKMKLSNFCLFMSEPVFNTFFPSLSVCMLTAMYSTVQSKFKNMSQCLQSSKCVLFVCEWCDSFKLFVSKTSNGMRLTQVHLKLSLIPPTLGWAVDTTENWMLLSSSDGLQSEQVSLLNYDSSSHSRPQCLLLSVSLE